MYNHILVPFDGSKHSVNALQSAIELAGKMGSTSDITVIHVNPLIHLISTVGINIDIDQLLEDEGNHILQPADEALKDSGVAYTIVLVKGDPAHEICSEAKQGKYDLVVMGSRGLGAFSEVVLGSVSHKVLQHVACPVLLVK